MRNLRLLFFSLFFFICTTTSFAQGDSVFVDLSSAHSTVYSHLYFLQPESYEPQKAARVFQSENPEEAKELAIMLKQYLDATGLYVDLDVIPKEANYRDSLTGKQRYALFSAVPEIYLEKQGVSWYYSKQTAFALPKLHNSVMSVGSKFLMNLMPSLSYSRILGIEFWQWLGIVILFIITGLLHALLTWLVQFVLRQLNKRVSNHSTSIEGSYGVAKALSLMLLSVLLIKVVPTLQLPIGLSKYVFLLLKVLTPIYGTIAAYRAVNIVNYYLERRAEKTDTSLDDQLVPLIRKLLRVVVVVVGILFILSAFEFNITALLAGISIGGLAIALAAQDTLKNLFGSLMIFIDRPFQIGDAIEAPDISGSVEEIGFRSSRVRTFENSLVSVPNGRLADMTINNRGMRRYRRFKMMISLTYDTPPELIEKFVEGLREMVAHHPSTRKDSYEIHFNNMGATSLDILFYAFFEVAGWTDELRGRHEILIAILKLAEQLGVRFAFPTQTLQIEEFPEKKSLVPEYNTEETALSQKLEEFMSEYRQKFR